MNHEEQPAVNANRHGFVDDPATDVPKVMGDLLALDVATTAIHVYCCR